MKKLGVGLLVLVTMIACKNIELVNSNGYDNSIVINEKVVNN